MNEAPATSSTGSLQERVQSLKLPPQVRVPPRPRGYLRWLLILLLVGGAGGGYVWWKNHQANAGASVTVSAPQPTEMKKIAEAKDVVLEAGGYIVPAQKVQVSPKVGGQVEWLYKNLEEGTFVPKDTVIATLEKTEFEFDLRRAQAAADLAKARYEELKNGSRQEEIQQALAAIKETEETINEARDELTRFRNSGTATAQELVRADVRVRSLVQKLEQLKLNHVMLVIGPRTERIQAAWAEYQQALAERDKAQYRLDNTQVRSPISGVILEKKAEVGNTVRPEAFSNGLSASLCDMADLHNLEAEIDISERDIQRIYKGQKCRIRTEAYKDKEYDGYVSRLMPIASRSKASVTVKIKILIPENDVSLRPEMRARVQFMSMDSEQAPQGNDASTDQPSAPAATTAPAPTAPDRPTP